jgi:hypothetical protein
MQDEIQKNGRKYLAHVSPDEQQGAYVIIGPPEGLVDELDLPEPYATKLHNILYDRRIFTYKDISAMRTVTGVLQDLFQLDAQKLVETFVNYEKEIA